jgi:uncharacterized protein (TIGR02271 family)
MNMANTTTSTPGTTKAAIAGFFRDDSKAESAIEELRASGFSDSDIGVATPHQEGSVHNFWDRLTSRFGKEEHTEHAEDFEDSLRGSGIPEQQAGYFNSELAKGGVLVTVHAAPERATKAVSILQQNGADVGATAAQWRSDGKNTSSATSQNIQLLGEILRVHKERVSKGEVRLRKEVVTERQNIEVPVTREELVIERVPVEGREATGAQVGSGQQETRIPLSEERVRVEKKPVVNEEIHIGKRQVQDTKRISDDVRREELRTETEGDVDQAGVEQTKQKKRKTA